jgi:hypothetical protein
MSFTDISASANIAEIFAQTTSAWSSIDAGTDPSGRVGTTPEVCSHRPDPVVNIAWAYCAAGGAISCGWIDLWDAM